MKTTTLLIAALLPLFTSAQITIEKSYSGIGQVSVVNLEDYGHKYMITHAGAVKVELYNSDHSLWKTIHPYVPNGHTFIGVSYVSSKLFDLDAGLELILIYSKDGASPPNPTTQVINEDGTVIKTFATSFPSGVVKVDNDWKLIITVSTTPNYSEVYSLPGQQVYIQKPGGGDDAELSMYPNPMHDAATLEYTLPSGTSSGLLQVYNAAGAMVRSYHVTNQFSSIIINRGDLPAGSYIYRLQAQGVQPVSRPFIIQ